MSHLIEKKLFFRVAKREIAPMFGLGQKKKLSEKKLFPEMRVTRKILTRGTANLSADSGN